MIGLDMIIDLVNGNAVGVACAEIINGFEVTISAASGWTNRLGVDTAVANVTNMVLNLEIMSFARSKPVSGDRGIASGWVRGRACSRKCAIRYRVLSKVHLRNAKVREP